jgi:hypothetical protein
MKLKKAAVIAALDISLKRMSKSPDRLARNLVELGLNAFPDKISSEEQTHLLKELNNACKIGDAATARELFVNSFLS